MSKKKRPAYRDDTYGLPLVSITYGKANNNILLIT